MDERDDMQYGGGDCHGDDEDRAAILAALDRATVSFLEMTKEAARVQGENDALRGQVAALHGLLVSFVRPENPAGEYGNEDNECVHCGSYLGDDPESPDLEQGEGHSTECPLVQARQLLLDTASAAFSHDAAIAAKAREEERKRLCAVGTPWAQQFHDLYEELAPLYSYSTRQASRVPWNELALNHQNLMIEVAGRVVDAAIRSRTDREDGVL